MENIKIETKGTTLIVSIDTTVDLGVSKSGKTHMVASTKGNQKVSVDGKEIVIGINAYTK